MNTYRNKNIILPRRHPAGFWQSTPDLSFWRPSGSLPAHEIQTTCPVGQSLTNHSDE
jgi:hypothetical protein